MATDATNQATIEEWAELGFFYDVDDEKKEWVFIGSKNGLESFPKLLEAYAADRRNAKVSVHEHYGPYMYLKIITLEEPEVDPSFIGGPLQDIAKLAVLFKEHLAASGVGDQFEIGQEFCPDAEYRIVAQVRENSFHPAMADAALAEHIARTNCL